MRGARGAIDPQKQPVSAHARPHLTLNRYFSAKFQLGRCLRFAYLRLFLMRTRRHPSFHLLLEVLFAPVARDTLKVQRAAPSILFPQAKAEVPHNMHNMYWR